MIKEQSIKSVGKIQKTHGLKGELNMILSISPEFFEDDNPMILEIDGIYVPFYAESIRPKGATTDLVKLDGIDSEEEARKLVNKEIYAIADDLKEFIRNNKDGDDELYSPNALIGMDVIDATNGNIGKVSDVDDNTANILLVVDSPDDRKIYIPLVDDFIIGIDPENNIIDVNIPEDLLNLN